MVYTKIPGDVISDLYLANMISHPYHDNNFLDDAHVWMGHHDYTTFNSFNREKNKDHNDLEQHHAHNLQSAHRRNVDMLSYHHRQHIQKVTKASYSSCHTSNDTRYNAQKITTNQGLKKNYDIPGLKVRTRTWIYERDFTLPQITTSAIRPRNESYVLIIEGVKMGASIEINHEFIGNVTNQFRRYIFPIPSKLVLSQNNYISSQNGYKLNSNSAKTKNNTIRILFHPDIDTNGRFMACSGGWDWAPYTQNAEASCLSRRVWSFGIIKPVYIAKVSVSHPLIVHVIPKTFYLGQEGKGNVDVDPISMDNKECNDLNGDFHLIVDVHLYIPHENDDNEILEGDVIFEASFLKTNTIIPLKDGRRLNSTSLIVSLSLRVKRKDIELWWPRDIKKKSDTSRLYSLKVAYRNSRQGTMSKWIKKKIGKIYCSHFIFMEANRQHVPNLLKQRWSLLFYLGFRYVRLVTSNEYNDDNSSSSEGNGFHGFYFRINNKLINAKGANVVPMSQLEGLTDDEAYRTLVSSAARANMNTLRVWGGGTILPNSFYEACDELGILIYHDLMFVEEQFHSPVMNNEVEEEIRYIVRSLMFHPSIVLWNGCNECERKMDTTTDIYSNFVMRVVAEEDNGRPIWPSSPSSGWRTGVESETGLPNGNELNYWSGNKTAHDAIESHGPYLHGSSLNSVTSVNGHPSE